MNDRGEKIVSLARELLRDEPDESRRPGQPPVIGFRVLCAATLIAALASSALTFWARAGDRPIDRAQKTELDALVFYAVHLKGLSRDALRRDIEDRIGPDTFNDMTRGDFRIARAYLQNRIR
ncbi:MAG TPA: hypothetical protein VMV79_06150 [Alphaproteobacteria bacterium]|nr:hypothetical protein [Alphaproteobacteria bacterium]